MTLRRSNTRPAFTLIELLVVIGIIGALVALLIPIVGKVQRAAKGAATSAQLSAIANAIQLYYSDFKAYPGPIPNSQLGGTFYTAKVPAMVQATAVTSMTTTTYTKNGFTLTNQQQITGSENLVLGLLGGLEYDAADAQIAYNPNDIFPDNVTPAAKGATSLNPDTPKRYAAYLQVKAGEISNCRDSLGNPTFYTDDGTRQATDSIIPEFLDPFPGHMPILYLRANVGADGVVTYAGLDETGTAVGPYQYDLAQILGYTQSSIGTTAGSANAPRHGLRDILPTAGKFTDTIQLDMPLPSNPSPPTGLSGKNEPATDSSGIASDGANALPYLKDPNSPAFQPDGTTANTNALAHPRQKDGFILISAGPDGVYGTPDDIIYPGSLNP